MADYAIQAHAQDINFVSKFTTDLHNLLAVLSKENVEVMAPGTALKTYKTSGTLSTETVAEKALIPDSGITVDDGTLVELVYSKYRNMVGIESVGKKGYFVAVGGANTALLKQIQAAVRKTIFDGLAVGTGAETAATFQMKIAKAAAYVSKKFEDEAHTPVFFASPDDVYGYLGEHNVTLEQNFGLSYLQNFMGIGNVIVDSNVKAGTVYGTATENLNIVAADIKAIPGMELTTDESGIIAVHNSAKYENAALETVAYTGLKVYPVYADRIVAVTTAG